MSRTPHEKRGEHPNLNLNKTRSRILWRRSHSPTIRCAIYTRKSTEERLDLEFNSLDAQREAAESFIASQKSEGWVCLPKHYNDGGFSGGNLDRPAYNELMKDIEAGEIDCVIVYKVDRLSRSLFDFAQTMRNFDANGVSFVSVTQQFNTTNSMGRLTLNILLSFAQFEREIISERISDKIAAQRQKGFVVRWTTSARLRRRSLFDEPQTGRQRTRSGDGARDL